MATREAPGGSSPFVPSYHPFSRVAASDRRRTQNAEEMVQRVTTMAEEESRELQERYEKIQDLFRRLQDANRALQEQKDRHEAEERKIEEEVDAASRKIPEIYAHWQRERYLYSAAQPSFYRDRDNFGSHHH